MRSFFYPVAGLPKARNVWLYDKTVQDGVKIATFKTIAEELVILPYIFRKVVKSWYRQNVQLYCEALCGNRKFIYDPENTSVNLEKLFEDGNPRVFVMSDQDFVRLDEVVDIKKDSLQMKKHQQILYSCHKKLKSSLSSLESKNNFRDSDLRDKMARLDKHPLECHELISPKRSGKPYEIRAS